MNPYLTVLLIALASMTGVAVIAIIIMGVKYLFDGRDNICRVYLMKDSRILCPKDGMNQHIEICRFCPHYKGFNDYSRYVLCNYHNRLAGDF